MNNSGTSGNAHSDMFVSKPGADMGDKQQGGSQQNRIDQFIQKGIEDFKEGALHNDVQKQKH